MGKKYGFIVAFIVIILLIYAWVSRFGLSLPPIEDYALPLGRDAWLLVCVGLIATAIALLFLFLDFKLSRSAAFIGWVFYFPVLFNTLIPMFIMFFSVIGVFYTPWLFFTDLEFANRIINGHIRLQNEYLHISIETLGYILIIAGLAVYILSLYQLLSHAKKGRKLLTKGFYGLVRHPQYLGIFLWTFGFAICGWRLINYLMWLTLCYSYILLAEFEEAEMEKIFGKEYENYKNSVPLIMPYIKLNFKPVSTIASKRKIRLLAYTVLYLLLLTTFYYILEPYIVVYR
ncbi:MAG: isoprenylcysteine carboxylmethyltransferase family protein [Candidatus Bathyarchaeia archaeon]